MASDYVDLEISLVRLALSLPQGSVAPEAAPPPVYELIARYENPDAEERVEPKRAMASFNLEILRQLQFDPVGYGRELSQKLFCTPVGDSPVDAGLVLTTPDGQRLVLNPIGERFKVARALAESQNRFVRLRLLIDRSASELHSLRWETLCDPLRLDDADPWLLAQQRVLFSRFLDSDDWRSVQISAPGALSGLVVIANPPDLPAPAAANGRAPAPVDVAAELQLVTEHLGADLIKEQLVSGPNQQVTLNRLIDRLHAGCDILYLVCHGSLVDEVPYLWLEPEPGLERGAVPATELVRQIYNMARPPVLVVLVSCQSAGNGREAQRVGGGMLAALGPQLVYAGVPAVLAMQGDIYMSTVARFMPRFFRELRADGQIDRAAAVARAALQREDGQFDDRWMPTLFMRLRRGRLWSAAPSRQTEPFPHWRRLLNYAQRDKTNPLLPIIGPGLTQSLLGTPRDIARRWARDEGFPEAALSRAELPQIAQYIATLSGEEDLRTLLIDYLGRELLNAYKAIPLPGLDLLALREQWDDLPDERRIDRLCALIAAIGRARRAAPPPQRDPYQTLARLNLPIFVTANYDDLLSEALRAEKKNPQIEIFPWKPALEQRQAMEAEPKKFSPKRPLVYHLFGRLAHPDSLVLSEDDCFDYLMAFSRFAQAERSLIPHALQAALSRNPLLFVGFQIEDWQFRTLFRSLLPAGTRQVSQRVPEASVAVQIEGGEQEMWPSQARRYLERYFTRSSISLYRGSPHDFLDDLAARIAG